MAALAVNPERLPFRSGTKGAVRVGFGALDDRPVVAISIDPRDGQTALTSSDGESLAVAAQMAGEPRLAAPGAIFR